MKTLCIFLICCFQVLACYSTPPEILWSNRDTHISGIYNSVLSETGDSVIIFEKNYINFYDSKNYDLISRHHKNVFENITYFHPNTSSNNILLRFPLIVTDYNIYNFENYTVDVCINSPIGKVLNFDYFKERDILVYTHGYGTVGKFGATYYSTVTSYDFQTRKGKGVCELASDDGIVRIFDAAIINDNEFLVSCTNGFFLYYVNSKIFHRLDSLKFPESSKHTRIQNYIYFFNSQNDDKIISYNTLTGTHTNFHLDLSQFNNLDSFNIISKESQINKPGDIFVKYSYYKNNSQGEPEKYYGLAGMNLQNNLMIFNINVKYIPTIIGHDGKFVHIRYQDTTKNEADELSEVFQKIQISNGEIILEKRLFKTLKKTTYVTQNEILRINNNKVEKIDKSNGKQVSSIKYNDTIQRLYTYANSDEYFILSKSNKISYSTNPEYYDYHYIDLTNTKIRVSPDQSVILLISHDIAIMDAKTTRLIDLISCNGGPIEFFTDSTFSYFYNGYRIYNIKTRTSYAGHFIGYSLLKFRKTNNEGIFVNFDDANIVKIDLAHPEVYDSFYSNKDLGSFTNVAISDDEKYIAIIRKYHDINHKTQFFIVDKDSNEVIYKSPILDWENMYFDILFLHDQYKIVYSEVNYGQGTSKITLFDVVKKEVIAQIEVPIHKAKNYLTTLFYTDNRNIEITDDNKIIVHCTLEGALVLNSEDLSVEKRLDFSKHTDEYNALGYNEYEQIYKYYLWKQDQLFSFQLFTYNPPTPQLILSENLINNDLHRRLFIHSNHISFNFRTKPLFGVAFNDQLYEIDYRQQNFQPKLKLKKQSFKEDVTLSSDDIKLAVGSYQGRFEIINLKTGNNYPAPPIAGWNGSFAFNNNYFIQSTDQIMYVNEINRGKFVDTLISKTGSFFGYPRLFQSYGSDYLITGHDDGFVRFWKQWLPNSINKINLGSSITEMYLIDNDTKLYVNTETGFHYLIQINDSIFSDVENNSVSNNNTMNIYPNPAEDFITIQIQPSEGLEPSEGYKVQIFNMLGIEMMSVGTGLDLSSQRIDISTLPSGVYYIKIGDKVEKFVKM